MKQTKKENTMRDLIPDPNAKPMKRTKDNLSPLLDMLNDPKVTGAEVPPGAGDEATPPPPDPIFSQTQSVRAVLNDSQTGYTDPLLPAAKRPALNRVFLTGRLRAGKDTALAAAGFKILSLAGPLYELAAHFYPGQPKELTREFLQRAGQWGRNFIGPGYPLTTERALFISMIRSLANAGAFKDFQSPVDWDSYGRNSEIWLDACVARAESEPTARIGISNVRFQNEKERLISAGFVGVHTMCSSKSWLARLKKDNIPPNSPVLNDNSEQLAAGLDASVLKLLSREPRGPKLKCIWSDTVLAPSSRLMTIDEFKTFVGL